MSPHYSDYKWYNMHVDFNHMWRCYFNWVLLLDYTICVRLLNNIVLDEF